MIGSHPPALGQGQGQGRGQGAGIHPTGSHPVNLGGGWKPPHPHSAGHHHGRSVSNSGHGHGHGASNSGHGYGHGHTSGASNHAHHASNSGHGHGHGQAAGLPLGKASPPPHPRAARAGSVGLGGVGQGVGGVGHEASPPSTRPRHRGHTASEPPLAALNGIGGLLMSGSTGVGGLPPLPVGMSRGSPMPSHSPGSRASHAGHAGYGTPGAGAGLGARAGSLGAPLRGGPHSPEAGGHAHHAHHAHAHTSASPLHTSHTSGSAQLVAPQSGTSYTSQVRRCLTLS